MLRCAAATNAAKLQRQLLPQIDVPTESAGETTDSFPTTDFVAICRPE
jgi:hypothetical protein